LVMLPLRHVMLCDISTFTLSVILVARLPSPTYSILYAFKLHNPTSDSLRYRTAELNALPRT
jgi:hypothetical protein